MAVGSYFRLDAKLKNHYFLIKQSFYPYQRSQRIPVEESARACWVTEKFPRARMFLTRRAQLREFPHLAQRPQRWRSGPCITGSIISHQREPGMITAWGGEKYLLFYSK